MVSGWLSLGDMQHGKTRMTYIDDQYIPTTKLLPCYGSRCKHCWKLLGLLYHCCLLYTWLAWPTVCADEVGVTDQHGDSIGLLCSYGCSRPTSRPMPTLVTKACSLLGYVVAEIFEACWASCKVANGKSDRQAPAYMSVVSLLITSKQHSLGCAYFCSIGNALRH